jgi:hypothetical protein
MVKFNGVLFFVNLIVGLYFINMGFTPNFVNLAFLDSIKNWIEIGGGALLIISGLMSMSRRTPHYR